MRTSDAGAKFIFDREGCKLKAYPDPITGGAPWACGVGCTGVDIGPNTQWSMDYAQLRYSQELSKRESIINDQVHVPLQQGQFDALVSILFNVGYGNHEKDGIFMLKTGQPSTLIRKLNAGDYQGAADQFPLWCSPGSNVEAGLKARREAERDMFVERMMLDPPAPLAPIAPDLTIPETKPSLLQTLFSIVMSMVNK